MLSIPAFSGFSRWVQRCYPSRVLRDDPLQAIKVQDRYVPIPLAGWKFTPAMSRALLTQRIFKPLEFSVRRLGVVIPVRDREAHLAVLLPRLIDTLRAQGIAFSIVVSEQAPGKPWNKGAIINAGIRRLQAQCDYLCFHDVDAIPVNGNYLCPSQPLRLVTKLIGSRNGLERPPRYFGGVITALTEQVIAANGFSNEYWGWGKEDDDFLFRLLFSGYLCYSDTQGVFEDLHNPAHQQVQLSSIIKPATLRRNRRRRSCLMRGLLDFRKDGLAQSSANILREETHPTFERILVHV